MSVFFHFSWQLPHLDRGKPGLPQELWQTPGGTQSLHSGAAQGRLVWTLDVFFFFYHHICIPLLNYQWLFGIGVRVLSGAMCSIQFTIKLFLFWTGTELNIYIHYFQINYNALTHGVFLEHPWILLLNLLVFIYYSVDLSIVLLYCYATWYKNFLRD